MLSATFGVIGLHWVGIYEYLSNSKFFFGVVFMKKFISQQASPACTELEVITMNWLGKLINLPEGFLNSSSGPGGGVIQVST